MRDRIIEDRYIGDGVYASFDGYHIILDLRKQDASRIALEPEVIDQLLRYRGDIAALAKARPQEGG